MQALDILRNKLVGSFISRFSIGDTWDFYIDGYWLIAQDIGSEDELFLSALLNENYFHFKSTIDKEYISKSSIAAAAMRREIVNVNLDKACSLEVEFDRNFKLLFPTNAATVDWQWCLNKTGVDPYRDYVVACFWEGKIEVNEMHN